jgi:aminoglycoside/choline kinase family phosphotransferase
MNPETLLQQTRIRFPRFHDAAVKISPIKKGGSDRKFYRIELSSEHTLILVKYTLEREENRRYVEIAEFLAAQKIRVPNIYFHDPSEGLIWIEDLGEADLWSYRDESWLVRRAFYELALEEIAKLHGVSEAQASKIGHELPAEFNAALYVWEQHYFFENCLGRYFGLDGSKLRSLMQLPALSNIAEHLASLPRVLVHRDFQSQNIIMRNGQAHLIDFQGLGLGLAEYDLASLLYDPYVKLSSAECEELLLHYRTIAAANNKPVRAQFDGTLRRCAMQRLMQALGAYSFLGLVKGHKHFLQHIPKAVRSLRNGVAKIDQLKPLESFLDGIC